MARFHVIARSCSDVTSTRHSLRPGLLDHIAVFPGMKRLLSNICALAQLNPDWVSCGYQHTQDNLAIRASSSLTQPSITFALPFIAESPS